MSAQPQVPTDLAPPPAAGESFFVVASPAEQVALLEADPELLRYVAAEDAQRAGAALRAPAVDLPVGLFSPGDLFAMGTNCFAAMVVSGVINQEIFVTGQPSLRLLGPGDIIPGRAPDGPFIEPAFAWSAATPTRVALLDDHFLMAARRWPRLVPALLERALDTQGGVLLQLAVSQQPRVEDRLVMLFRNLADRWGRMTPEGVVVSLRLTHESLGRMVGARRPTITLALRALAEAGRLVRLPEGTWLLSDLGTPA